MSHKWRTDIRPFIAIIITLEAKNDGKRYDKLNLLNGLINSESAKIYRLLRTP